MQTCLAFGSGNRIPFSCGGALDAPSACSGVRRRRFTTDKNTYAWNDKGNALKSLNRSTEADDAFAKAKELGYKV